MRQSLHRTHKRSGPSPLEVDPFLRRQRAWSINTTGAQRQRYSRSPGMSAASRKERLPLMVSAGVILLLFLGSGRPLWLASASMLSSLSLFPPLLSWVFLCRNVLEIVALDRANALEGDPRARGFLECTIRITKWVHAPFYSSRR